MNSTALPLREPFLRGESLTSFVRRHVVAMGYEHLGRLLSQAERTKFPRHLELLGRGPPLVALAQLLRRDTEELIGLTVHAWAVTLVVRERTAPTPQTCDSQTTLRFFDVAHRRICPCCLREARVWERLLWSFRPLVICPDHGVFLINRCPQCRRAFSPRRLELAYCRCGAALASESVTTAGAAALETTGLIADWLRIGRPESLDLPNGASFSWLDSLQAAILRTPTWISRARLEMELPEAVDDEATAWLAAADLLRTWPSALADLVDEVQSNTRHRGPTTRMGRSLSTLLRQSERLERQGYPAPADGLREHLLQRYTRGHITRKGILFREAGHQLQLAERPWITQTEAARRLGLRPPSVAGLVRRGVLKGRIEPSGPRGRTNGVVSSESVTKYAARLKGAWSVKQTAERLGIDAPRVVELVRANVLRDAVRGPLGWLIPVDVITDLLDRLQRLTVVPQDRQNVVSFRDALRRFGVRGLSVVTIADRLLRNELAAFRNPQCTGLGGLVFAEADLQRLSRELQTERRQIAGYSLRDVASALVSDRRVGSRCLRKWIAAGLLRAQRRRKAWWIAPDEVHRFHATYCLARETCRLLGVARSTLDRWEVEKRLVPIYGRRTHPGTGSSVFLRADVERLITVRAA